MPDPITVDLSAKTCLVTGATAGIGKEIARGLARLDARVVLACRSVDRGRAAKDDIARTTKNDKVELLEVDLSDQRSIRTAAAKFVAEHEYLHVLINNAGVWTTTRQTSVDGLELTFATNVLGYHLLTRELLPLLEKSAPARIVNVASGMAKGLDLNDLLFERRKYDGLAAYAQSKQANRMLSWTLAERLLDKRITVNALHPGVVNTELVRDASGVVGMISRTFFKVVGRTPEQGADTPLWLAAAIEVEGLTGKLWKDRKEVDCPFRDKAQLEALYAKCEALVAPKA